MTKMERRLVVIMVGLALCWAGQAGAAPGGLPLCEAKLNTCSANLAVCTTGQTTCQANLNTCAAVLGTCTTDLSSATANLGTCTTGLSTATANLGACTTDLSTAIANLGACTTDLNTETVNLETCTTGLNTSTVNLATCTTDLSACNAALAAAQQFPATGQLSCWGSSGSPVTCGGTGHDGNVQAGAALTYTDNGDGTITDSNTGLTWAKKSDDGSIHDKDNVYTWAAALAVHIAGLNTAAFAAYTDWRLPNVKELQSIVNYQNAGPAVSPEFNNSCAASCTVLTCSCTAAFYYWTSSSNASGPADAWAVSFGGGNVNAGGKSSGGFVRAVRGGL